MNARQAAREAGPRLVWAGVDDALLEAELLARAATGLTRAQYFAGHQMCAQQLTHFHDLVTRRLQREPSAYIRGTREFFGREFEVTPHTLIPRPETELLVDLALSELHGLPSPSGRGAGGEGENVTRTITSDLIEQRQSPPLHRPVERGSGGEVVLDIGTGTGCVAISVALEAPHATVIATDISRRALAIARRNGGCHQAPVQFIAGDLASAIGRADIILTNLPYIPTGDLRALDPEVRDYEPTIALDGGADGLDLIRRLIDDCAVRLRPRLLALEVGYGQADSVATYAHRQGAATQVHQDLAGIDRVVCARWA